MIITATRPLFIAGKNFRVGDQIPDSLILGSRIKVLEDYGLINVVTKVETEKEIKKIYNPDKLKNLRKKELVNLAHEQNPDLSKKILTQMTNKELINVITEK